MGTPASAMTSEENGVRVSLSLTTCPAIAPVMVGVTASMITVSPLDDALTLPAASVAVAVTVCVPLVSAVVTMLHTPVVASALAVPSKVVPSVSYSATTAPASAVPVKVGVVTLVMRSVFEAPLSDEVDSVGEGAAGAAESSVMVKAAELLEVLPATSVWLTITEWTPSPIKVMPPSLLYCQAEFVARPVTLMVPSRVSVSVLLLPVSALSVSVGATAALSSVKVKVAESLEVLPATSVCLTTTDLVPSPLSVKLAPVPVLQLVPPSVLYCQIAFVSRPVTLTIPSLVIVSVLLLPVSAASASVGAATVVSSTKAWLATVPSLPALSVTLSWRVVLLVSVTPFQVSVVPETLLVMSVHVAPLSSEP